MFSVMWTTHGREDLFGIFLRGETRTVRAVRNGQSEETWKWVQMIREKREANKHLTTQPLLTPWKTEQEERVIYYYMSLELYCIRFVIILTKFNPCLQLLLGLPW